MIDLHQLQLEMQRSIMAGAHDASFVEGSDTQERAQRLGIYASAYRSRLQEALAHNYPMLQVHLGDAVFAALANDYITAHPSTFASIRLFGDQLASWLGEPRPSEPWLRELASFEWSLGCAFDAQDDPAALSMDALANIAPDRWADLCFGFARGAKRLSLETNAAELYAEAARGERINGGRIEATASEWLLWRQALAAHYRSMTAVEALAFDALASGETFGEACARLLEAGIDDADVPLQAAACLKRWFADELIVAYSLA
jgi:hypothetical protein